MSCPDWFSLVTRRDDEPERWQRALLHHETCDLCREEALDAEPTLLFQRMAAPELDRQEIADIKQAVATMRRTLPLTEAAEKPAPSPLRADLPARPSRSSKPWLRAAALGAVLLGATWFGGSLFNDPSDQGEPPTNLASLTTPAAQGIETSLANGDRALAPASSDFSQKDLLPGQDSNLDELPLVEEADPAYGSIVEVVGQDISFVLVLPSLDV